jgi:hypothetical protein
MLRLLRANAFLMAGTIDPFRHDVRPSKFMALFSQRCHPQTIKFIMQSRLGIALLLASCLFVDPATASALSKSMTPFCFEGPDISNQMGYQEQAVVTPQVTFIRETFARQRTLWLLASAATIAFLSSPTMAGAQQVTREAAFRPDMVFNAATALSAFSQLGVVALLTGAIYLAVKELQYPRVHASIPIINSSPYFLNRIIFILVMVLHVQNKGPASFWFMTLFTSLYVLSAYMDRKMFLLDVNPFEGHWNRYVDRDLSEFVMTLTERQLLDCDLSVLKVHEPDIKAVSARWSWIRFKYCYRIWFKEPRLLRRIGWLLPFPVFFKPTQTWRRRGETLRRHTTHPASQPLAEARETKASHSLKVFTMAIFAFASIRAVTDFLSLKIRHFHNIFPALFPRQSPQFKLDHGWLNDGLAPIALAALTYLAIATTPRVLMALKQRPLHDGEKRAVLVWGKRILWYVNVASLFAILVDGITNAEDNSIAFLLGWILALVLTTFCSRALNDQDKTVLPITRWGCLLPRSSS